MKDFEKISIKSSRMIMMFIVLFCVIAGLLLRIIYLIKYPTQARDAYIYADFIYNWIELGKAPIIKYYDIPPLSIFLLKITTCLTGCDPLKGGIIINMAIGCLLIIVLIELGWSLSQNFFITSITGLLAATHPSLIHYSCQVLRENSYLLFLTLYFYCLTKYFKKRKVVHIFLMANFSAMSVLCRHEGLELIVFSFFVLLLEVLTRRRFNHLIAYIILHCIWSGFVFVATSKVIGVDLTYYRFYFDEAASDDF